MSVRIPRPIAGLSMLLMAPAALAGDLTVEGQIVSTTTANPPLQVQSSKPVPNLNADKLDGFDVGDFATPGSGVGVHYKNVIGTPGGEIDQDCAVNTGCFGGGDSAGFPVTITQPGSYRLIGNLQVADPAKTAVLINAAGAVTLDLNGFRISGPADCSGSPASCTSTGAGSGVDTSTFNVTVRNGDVHGMGSVGVHLAAGALVENVRATGNGSNGIQAAQNSRIVDSTARKNGHDGIIADADSVLTNNVAVDNGNDGMSITGSRASGNTASDNGMFGIECGGSCVIQGNRATGNADVGLRIPGASTIIGNVSNDNGGDGIINTFAAGTILNNTVLGNTGIGLQLRGSSAYAHNLVRGNSGGTVSGGVEIGQNLCGTNTTCP